MERDEDINRKQKGHSWRYVSIYVSGRSWQLSHLLLQSVSSVLHGMIYQQTYLCRMMKSCELGLDGRVNAIELHIRGC